MAYVWSAPHSQIYPELRRMERDGLVDVEVVPRGQRALKRRYLINASGRAELTRWLGEIASYQPERDVYRLRAAHFELSDYDTARRQLQDHLNHYQAALLSWRQVLSDVERRRVPLLLRRLSQRPAAEHEAIVAFKRFAFRGEVAKAEMEIRWAQEGLDLIADLEHRNMPLWGQADEQPRRRGRRRSRTASDDGIRSA